MREEQSAYYLEKMRYLSTRSVPRYASDEVVGDGRFHGGRRRHLAVEEGNLLICERGPAVAMGTGPRAVNRLVDRRLLFECAVTHYAALNATAEQLDELDRLTHDMADSTDWSDYHQADEQFHQLVGIASGLGTAVEAYHETFAELYAYFIPYPIELLHKSNCDHVALMAALRAGDGNEAVEISRKHVDILHRTMFMGLTDGGTQTVSMGE